MRSDKSQNNLFLKYMDFSINSSQNQSEYMNVMVNVCSTMLNLLKHENLIIDLNYNPSEFWPKAKNKTVAFVDGGLARNNLFNSSPLAIRAGSYVVNKKLKEEAFDTNLKFVLNLFDKQNELFDFIEDESFESLMLTKKKDAARIITEAGQLVNHILTKRKIDLLFLHGPIQAVLTPFVQEGFPPFTNLAIQSIIPSYKKKNMSVDDRHFINVYHECIKLIKNAPYPIYGVLETAISSAYTRNLLYAFKTKGVISQKDYDETINVIKEYRITDNNIFEVILKKNQALKPLEIQKQFYGSKIIQKSRWDEKIIEYPNVFVGFIKVNDFQSPIRIESYNYPKNLINDFSYILAVSKLLPSYSYPVGLHVVDRFVKIPQWMKKASKNYWSTHALKSVMNNQKLGPNSLVLKYISNKNRTWANRPKKSGGRVEK